MPQVAHVDGPGDPFAKLLNILGLHATSVDFQRRLATHETMLWNLANFRIGPGTGPVTAYFEEVTSRGMALLGQLGLNFAPIRKLFGLLFSSGTSGINGPIVDDVDTAADEKLSETTELPAQYGVKITQDDVENVEVKNYIGWLINTDINTLKQQQFLNPSGEPLPIPTPLLYRMLHRSLLLSTYEATMTVFQGFQLLDSTVKREQDFTNIEAGRTVTRGSSWKQMSSVP